MYVVSILLFTCHSSLIIGHFQAIFLSDYLTRRQADELAKKKNPNVNEGTTDLRFFLQNKRKQDSGSKPDPKAELASCRDKLRDSIRISADPVRFRDCLVSLDTLKFFIEYKLMPIVETHGVPEDATSLAEHILELLAFSGFTLSSLRGCHSKGRSFLLQSLSNYFEPGQNLLPLGITSDVVANILDEHFIQNFL
jgi:hypothetical protein